QQSEVCNVGRVTYARAGGDDAGVAAGAVGELRCDFAKEFLGDAGSEDVGGGLAAGSERVALAGGGELFGDGARGLGARQRGGDAAVLEQVGDKVAQGGTTVPRIAA